MNSGFNNQVGRQWGSSSVGSVSIGSVRPNKIEIQHPVTGQKAEIYCKAGKFYADHHVQICWETI